VSRARNIYNSVKYHYKNEKKGDNQRWKENQALAPDYLSLCGLGPNTSSVHVAVVKLKFGAMKRKLNVTVVEQPLLEECNLA
jgi:hypothetical protein